MFYIALLVEGNMDSSPGIWRQRGAAQRRFLRLPGPGTLGNP